MEIERKQSRKEVYIDKSLAELIYCLEEIDNVQYRLGVKRMVCKYCPLFVGDFG